MNEIGLVLEGGGMRGTYTAGVLEAFMEHELYVPYVAAVSAGASVGASYISRQQGRNRKVTIDWIDDPRYLSWRNLLKEKSLFGMNFLFDELPRTLEPFDYDALKRSGQRFVVGTTDCRTGEPRYFEKDEGDLFRIIRASSSLPYMAPIVEIDGVPLLDGGVSDPIPLRKSEQDGNRKHVLVLTRNAGYRKQPSRLPWIARQWYRQYPGLLKAMERRHRVYNETLDRIESLERSGEAFVFRPSQPLQVDRMEKNKAKLLELFELGRQDALSAMARLKSWLDEPSATPARFGSAAPRTSSDRSL